MQSKVIKYLGLYTEPAKNYNDLAKPDVTWAKKSLLKIVVMHVLLQQKL